MPRAIQEAMLQAAIAAPSPDNSQPWLFRITDEGLHVYLDHARSLPSDVMSMFDMTSIGAAVENAVIAASHLGYQPEVLWQGGQVSESVGAQPIAEIRLHPNGSPDSLYAAIAKRCTCRKMYSSAPLDEQVLGQLAAACARFPEVQVDWLTTSQDKSRFGRLVASTDSLRFQHQPFHEELFRQLRLTAKEAEASADGLDVRTLELPPGMSSLLPMLRSWKTMQTIIRLKLLPLLSAPAAASVRRSGAIAVVSVPEQAVQPSVDPRKIFFTGGRAIERMWLTAAELGLSMHPLGSISIFLLQECPKPEFEPTIQRVRNDVQALIPSLCGRVIQLALRVGQSPPPSRRSLRRPADEVIIGQ